jgi:hypothetical protein
MAEIKPPLMKILAKTYTASSMIDLKFGRYDISFKTDEKGRPILLFIGKRLANGTIAGNRYARRLAQDRQGNIIKDHWDHKGLT